MWFTFRNLGGLHPNWMSPNWIFGMARVVFFICLSFISYEEDNCLKLNLLGSLWFWHRPSADVRVLLCVIILCECEYVLNIFIFSLRLQWLWCLTSLWCCSSFLPSSAWTCTAEKTAASTFSAALSGSTQTLSLLKEDSFPIKFCKLSRIFGNFSKLLDSFQKYSARWHRWPCGQHANTLRRCTVGIPSWNPESRTFPDPAPYLPLPLCFLSVLICPIIIKAKMPQIIFKKMFCPFATLKIELYLIHT